jgi:dTDP-4-dehydrorhamnose reductase
MKVILFGSTGMLGCYVYSYLSNNNITVIPVNRNIYNVEENDKNKLDIILSEIVNEDDTIINCIGIIPQREINNNYRKFIVVNTLFPHILYDLSIKYNTHFIHITTDCVFSGNNGNYNVNDIHDSTSIYGITKSLGEPINATIIRTSIIGEELINKKSLLEWVLSMNNKTINGYNNVIWNGVTCLTLAKIILEILISNNYWKGIKHIYSPDNVTKYELCNYINQIYNLNIKIIKYDLSYNINMTLIGDNNYKIPDLYTQISEQKNYNLIR